MSQGDTQVESTIPKDFVIKTKNGRKGGKENVEKGFAVSRLEEKAESIVYSLGENIRNTK